jgi:hypothetical protein
MKQTKSIVIETQTWQPEHLIDMYYDIPIQDVINKLQALMADGYTHVRGEPKLMYDTPDEYSFAHETIKEIVFSKK